MEEEAQGILSEIIDKTDNNIIIFIVVLAVIFLFIVLPLYGMVAKDRKERLAAEAQREKNESNAQLEHDRVIIQVVTANTEAMTSLKAMLDNNSKAYYTSLERIHERIDSIAKTNTGIQQDVKQILQAVDKEVA